MLTSQIEERWISPDQMGPQGQAPGAKLRLVHAAGDGSKTFALILAPGDEVLTALSDFAHEQSVSNAHFVAMGAAREPEVGWFDPVRKQYKILSLDEQVEVLTLAGDIALGESGRPVVHAHGAFGRSDGSAWGGHLLRAIAWPTLEVYVTTYPSPLRKRRHPEFGVQVIDPSLPH